MNTLVNQYRDYLKQSGKSDNRSDYEITFALGEDARKNGMLDQQPEDFRQQYAQIKEELAPTIGEEFKSGLARGVRGLGSTAAGFGALVADWLPGEATDKYVRDPLLKKAQELEQGEPGDDPAPTWDDVHDAHSLGRYLASQTGNAIPSVAESILVSLGTAALGGAEAGPAGAAGGAAVGLVQQQAIKELAKSKLRNIIIAQGVNSLALSSGEIYTNLANDKDVDKDTARNLATGLGVIAAIPDSVLPSYVASKFLKPATEAAERGIQKSFLKELGKEAAKVIPGEGGTEAFQEWVGLVANRLAKGQSLDLTEADWKQMREAAVGGAVGGLLMTPVAAHGETRDVPPDVPAPASGAPPATPPVTSAAQRQRPAAPVAADLDQARLAALAIPEDDRALRIETLLRRQQSLTEQEKAELQLLQNLQVSREGGPVAPPPAAPPATEAPVAATPAAATPAPDPVAPAVPLVATPEAAPVEEVKPLSPEAIYQRVENLGNRLTRLVKRGGDDRAARAKLDAIVEAGSFNRENLDALEAEVVKGEESAIATQAKVKSGKATLLADREKVEKANLKAELSKKRSDKVLASLRENLKKITQGPEDGAGSAPNPGSGVEVAPAPAPAPTDVAPLSGRLTEAPVISELDLEKAKATDWKSKAESLVSEYTKKLGLDKKAEDGQGMRRHDSSKRSSAVGIVLLDTKTGQVHVRGLMNHENLLSTNGGGVVSGLAVQAMGKDSQTGGGRGKKGVAVVRTKTINAEGGKPVLLKELIEHGIIPINHLNFEAAGKYSQDFANREQFIAATNATPVVAALATKDEASVAKQAAKDVADVTADPIKAKAINKREQTKNNGKRESDNIGRGKLSIIANSEVADLADGTTQTGMTPMERGSETAAPKRSDAAPVSLYGEGPWEVQKHTRSGWETIEKIKPGKKVNDEAVTGKMADAIKGKSGKFRLVNKAGDEFSKTEQRRVKTRKVEAVATAANGDELNEAYRLLSQVAEESEDEHGNKIKVESPNWAAMLHTRMRGLDAEQTGYLLKDFLLGKGAFNKRFEGKNFTEIVGGYKKAITVLRQVLQNYDELSKPTAQGKQGTATPKADSGARTRRGSKRAADSGPEAGGGEGARSAGEAGGGAVATGGRAVKGGGRGVAEQRNGPELDLEGRELTENELRDAEVKGIYKSIERFGQGVFSANLLNRFPSDVRERILNILAERGTDWEYFEDYIQKEFDKSSNADEFLAAMRGEPEVKVSKSTGSLPEWTREEMVRRGIDPNRPLNDFDIGNQSVRAAISADPTLTAEEKKNLVTYGQTTPPHEIIGGMLAENTINPITGRIENPDVLPDTTAAAVYNLDEAERRGRQEKAVDPSAPASFTWIPANDLSPKARDQVSAIEASLNAEQRKSGAPLIRIKPVAAPAEQRKGGGERGAHTGLVNAINAIGRVFNKEVVFVEVTGGREGTMYLGMTDDVGVIVINKDSPFSALQVAGHELVHGLDAQRPDLYDKLDSFIREWAPMPAEYERRKKATGEYSDDEIHTEWVADVVGERFAEPEFWDAMQEYSKKGATPEQRSAVMSLSTWMGAWVRRILSAITRQLGGTSIHVRDLARAQDTIADIMAQYAATADYAKAMKAEVQKINKSTTREVEYVEASARVQAAAWNELLEEIGRQSAILMPQSTIEDFWRMVSRGDTPQAILEEIEKRVPGASRARINDQLNTPAMKSQAHYTAFRLAAALERYARSRFDRAVTSSRQLADRLDVLVSRFRKSERAYMDSAAMNATMVSQLNEILTGVSKDMDRVRDAAFEHGELTEAVRQIEGLARGEAIPESYQKVFAKIMASDGVTIFDHLSALAQLNLPLRDMTAQAIVDAMAKSGNPRLAELVASQKPLAVALSVLSRNAAKEMDLLQLRLLKDTARSIAIKQTLDSITSASDERLEAMWPALRGMISGADLGGRLQAAYVQDRRLMRRTQADLIKAGERARVNKAFADAIGEKRAEIGKASGDFASWVVADGGKYTAMRYVDGQWQKNVRTIRLAGSEVTSQHGQLSQDLAANRAWLQQHEGLKGTPLYNEVSLQTTELAKIDVSRKYNAAGRFFLDKMLTPLGQKFAQMGGAPGQLIAQMLQKYQFITRSAQWHDSIMAKSKKWDRSLQAVTLAAGFKAPQEFFRAVNDQVLYGIEMNPGKDEAATLRDAARTARRLIPADNKIAEDFNEKLADYLRRTKEISEYMLSVAEKNGVYIQDKRVKNLMRHAVQYGWLTVSRQLRTGAIKELVMAMDSAKWREAFAALPDDATEEERAAKQQAMLDAMTPDVVRLGIEPFIMKPGKEVFFGADRTAGRWSFLSQIAAQNAWQQSDGNVMTFIEQLFAQTYEARPDSNQAEDFAAYRDAMLGKIDAMLGMVAGLDKKVEKPSVFERSTPLPHRLMDGRTNDLIPPEFFSYDSFDSRSAEIQLAEIAFNSAFGRNGEKFDQVFKAMGADLAQRKTRYDVLRGVTEAQKRADAIARGWNWDELKTVARDANRLNSLLSAFNVHFNGTGMEWGSERAALEFLQTQAALILNQPTSALWNLPSILDYPLVIGGGLGVRSSARTLKHLMTGVFGSALGAANINIFRAAAYQKEIVQARQGEQSKLTFGEQTADIGRNAAYYEGGIGNRSTQASKYIQNAMKKGVGNSNGNLAFNGLWAPFNFLSEQVAVSVATANVENFELMVKRTMDFFRRNADALHDPAYRVTANDLGMTGPAFFSDERAFDYYRSKAFEYGIGSIEDIARTALEKGGRLLTEEQVLSVAQMAFNEVSLESSINSRPIEFTNNPLLRYGGMLLGWPLAKMNQIHVALKGVDGKKDLASAARGIAVLAAWSLPMGLAFSFLMDDWDEEVVGKRSNRRDIDKVAGLPVIGPILALTTGDRGFKSNLFGMLERGAKAGNIYGLGADFVNSAVNVVDPTAGQRDFSLDSRVLAFSQFATLRDMLRNLIHQDFTYTYESVGRPLMLALGGNGLIQAQQIVNQQLGLDNEERWIAERISVGNYLRAAGREAGIALKAGAGRSSPTPTSVWERQMWLSALGNDRMGFLEAWRAAVAAARKQGETDPEGYVLNAWRGRNPVSSVFATKPSDEEMTKLMRAMNDNGRQAVRDAIRMYDEYTDFIAPSPFERKIQRTIKAAQPKPFKLRPAASLY